MGCVEKIMNSQRIQLHSIQTLSKHVNNYSNLKDFPSERIPHFFIIFIIFIRSLSVNKALHSIFVYNILSTWTFGWRAYVLKPKYDKAHILISDTLHLMDTTWMKERDLCWHTLHSSHFTLHTSERENLKYLLISWHSKGSDNNILVVFHKWMEMVGQ